MWFIFVVWSIHLILLWCILQFAIKAIKKQQIGSECDMNRVRREIEIMSSLNHPHIISIYEGES